jgi:chromate transporter
LYGVLGGLIAWVLLHLPSFLILYGILPNWDSYRDRAGIQRIIIGMNCVALGFLLTSVDIYFNLGSNNTKPYNHY